MKPVVLVTGGSRGIGAATAWLAAQQGWAVAVNYTQDAAASKGAIESFTIGLARELAADGIRVNAVRPGVVDTEIHASRPPGQLAEIIRSVPLGRIGTPDDIARSIVFLACEEESSFVTGALLDARGGR